MIISSKFIRIFWLIALLLVLPPLLVFAQNKVVVIPLFGDSPSPSSIPAPVPKTGQTTTEAAGDDGALKKGVAWPNPRFTDNNDGTVTDNLTGLIWLKDASCAEFYGGDSTGQNSRPWADALAAANNLAAPYCGLSDGSTAGQWRLPNLRELQSLIDYGEFDPALPAGHPFLGNLSGNHWSSTTSASGSFNAWLVVFLGGYVDYYGKTNPCQVRAVRDGQ